MKSRAISRETPNVYFIQSQANQHVLRYEKSVLFIASFHNAQICSIYVCLMAHFISLSIILLLFRWFRFFVEKKYFYEMPHTHTRKWFVIRFLFYFVRKIWQKVVRTFVAEFFLQIFASEECSKMQNVNTQIESESKNGTTIDCMNDNKHT